MQWKLLSWGATIADFLLVAKTMPVAASRSSKVADKCVSEFSCLAKLTLATTSVMADPRWTSTAHPMDWATAASNRSRLEN